MSENKNVWIFIEQDEGKIVDVSLELMSKGRELADTLGSELWAVLAGQGVEGLCPELIGRGRRQGPPGRARRARALQDPALREGAEPASSRSTCPTSSSSAPRRVGRDLGPRVASASRSGLTADCTDLQIGDYESKKDNKVYKDLLFQIRPAFGGNLIATIVNPLKPAPDGHGARGRHEAEARRRRAQGRGRAGRGQLREVRPSAPGPLPRDQGEQGQAQGVDRSIVSGGMGVGGEDEFQLVRDLASVLGGEVGASRAAVDAGLISKEHQVGQTGTTVRPRLYIAAGISGAIQHRAGMAESNKIIAINTDPDAPIFQIAQYKIVGDLKEVIPLMISALREKAK